MWLEGDDALVAGGDVGYRGRALGFDVALANHEVPDDHLWPLEPINLVLSIDA